MSALAFGTPIRRPWPRRWRYSLAGAVIALAAPGGLFVARSVGSAAWVSYAYAAAFSLATLALLGWLHGRHEDRLLATSVTDPLTGLHNRRHLDARVQEEVAKAERYHTSLAALVIDVDRLKAINDRLGHAAGDRAITLVAEAVRACCRTGDFAARVGGDEFVVLAPCTTALEALGLARRIRARVTELAASAKLAPPAPSVSLGVADLKRTGRSTADGLLVTADDALYIAKSRGGDRAVLARDTRTRRSTAEFGGGPMHDYVEGEQYTGSGPFILSGSTVTTGKLPRMR
jgi:diguanylate cyclase (GGDEF)-like protein